MCVAILLNLGRIKARILLSPWAKTLVIVAESTGLGVSWGAARKCDICIRHSVSYDILKETLSVLWPPKRCRIKLLPIHSCIGTEFWPFSKAPMPPTRGPNAQTTWVSSRIFAKASENGLSVWGTRPISQGYEDGSFGEELHIHDVHLFGMKLIVLLRNELRHQHLEDGNLEHIVED